MELEHPQVPLRHSDPLGEKAQSVPLLHPHSPFTHAEPVAAAVQSTQCPAVPQLFIVFWHGPLPSVVDIPPEPEPAPSEWPEPSTGLAASWGTPASLPVAVSNELPHATTPVTTSTPANHHRFCIRRGTLGASGPRTPRPSKA
jgi:hypothetical protein